MNQPEPEPRFDDVDLERCHALFETISYYFTEAAECMADAVSSYTPDGQDDGVKQAIKWIAIAFGHMTKIPGQEVAAEKKLPLEMINKALILGSKKVQECGSEWIKDIYAEEMFLDDLSDES